MDNPCLEKEFFSNNRPLSLFNTIHFPGGEKTYLNNLPTIVRKTIKPTPTNPCPTIKARNRTPLESIKSSCDTNGPKAKRRRLFSDTHSSEDEVNTTTLEEPSQADENTDPEILELWKQKAERRMNEELITGTNG